MSYILHIMIASRFMSQEDLAQPMELTAFQNQPAQAMFKLDVSKELMEFVFLMYQLEPAD